MVRLETSRVMQTMTDRNRFTFQYGQIRNETTLKKILTGKMIYIPVWLDQKLLILQKKKHQKYNLHSSMVRLETVIEYLNESEWVEFTFQYGQIRNNNQSYTIKPFNLIYIPVWLDQKHKNMELEGRIRKYLHSSMVRLETVSNSLIIYVN